MYIVRANKTEIVHRSFRIPLFELQTMSTIRIFNSKYTKISFKTKKTSLKQSIFLKNHATIVNKRIVMHNNGQTSTTHTYFLDKNNNRHLD